MLTSIDLQYGNKTWFAATLRSHKDGTVFDSGNARTPSASDSTGLDGAGASGDAGNASDLARASDELGGDGGAGGVSDAMGNEQPNADDVLTLVGCQAIAS